MSDSRTQIITLAVLAVFVVSAFVAETMFAQAARTAQAAKYQQLAAAATVSGGQCPMDTAQSIKVSEGSKAACLAASKQNPKPAPFPCAMEGVPSGINIVVMCNVQVGCCEYMSGTSSGDASGIGDSMLDKLLDQIIQQLMSMITGGMSGGSGGGSGDYTYTPEEEETDPGVLTDADPSTLLDTTNYDLLFTTGTNTTANNNTLTTGTTQNTTNTGTTNTTAGTSGTTTTTTTVNANGDTVVSYYTNLQTTGEAAEGGSAAVYGDEDEINSFNRELAEASAQYGVGDNSAFSGEFDAASEAMDVATIEDTVEYQSWLTQKEIEQQALEAVGRTQGTTTAGNSTSVAVNMPYGALTPEEIAQLRNTNGSSVSGINPFENEVTDATTADEGEGVFTKVVNFFKRIFGWGASQ